MARIDVFISHSPSDKRLAEGIRYVLRGAGLSCWLDSSETATGDILPRSVLRAADNCRSFCSLVTPRYTELWFNKLDSELARHGSKSGSPTRLLGCLMEGEVPRFLNQRPFIDFRKDPAKAQVELTAALRGQGRLENERGTWAVLNAAPAFLGTVLLSTNRHAGERRAAEADYHVWLLGLATRSALGRALATRGIPVPEHKDDRISALLESTPVDEILADALTEHEVARICNVLDLPASASKSDNVRRLLGEQLAHGGA